MSGDRANSVAVALGPGGKLSVTYAAPSFSSIAHVIFDATGYFVPVVSDPVPPSSSAPNGR
jgi:hypothetical protein